LLLKSKKENSMMTVPLVESGGAALRGEV